MYPLTASADVAGHQGRLVYARFRRKAMNPSTAEKDCVSVELQLNAGL